MPITKEEIEEMLKSGPMGAVFAGGAGVAVMGLALGVARSSSRIVVTSLQRQLTTTLEVTSKDASFPWILHWLHEKGSGRLRHVSVSTSAHGEFELVPAPGRHWVTYEGWPLLVERAREYGTVNASSGVPWEKVLITGATGSTERFTRLLQEAKDACLQARDTGVTTVLTCWGTDWRPFGAPRRKRPLDSVVLRPGLADAVVADILDWKQSEDWYRQRGVPYRRGYLLHGPPGGGKTSFVLALAGHFKLDVCLLSLSDDALSDDRLALALANVPTDALVLLEDIDAAFPDRQRYNTPQNSTLRSSLTLSGLLNALDGAAAAEGRLLFMTTNFLERLDEALLRPGRVDVVHKLDDATLEQADFLFRSFFDLDENDQRPRDFANAALRASLEQLERRPSMAELQAFLIAHKHDPDIATQHANQVADLALARASSSGHNLSTSSSANEPSSYHKKSRGRRVLTHLEVDKMTFNPQPDW
eukprot:CAMPEP_0197315624 /NCGR_PEP_ID=MMETSP0891-20130614/39148_1 /TAXON_ID=44058 ORGANISM="Aureoumbra lagunensis, Strain CCMP1510" /NCGR_SAMPLE_ID=MMETSP0891 /ASSEMBLY_ACC=CAM_ASM_000534 /LENGTH=474 /DNA_ID=CAMNT_0042804697 /DNA_START=37 /DNA_END=1458 /DNA_ORIENTATION=+